jgi:hypothetical protein
MRRWNQTENGDKPGPSLAIRIRRSPSRDLVILRYQGENSRVTRGAASAWTMPIRPPGESLVKDAGQYTTQAATMLEASPPSDWPYRCAMSLLKHPADDAIAEQLAFMGETSDADRAWMIEYRPDLLRLRNTHEWCRGQTQPFVAELQDVPTTLIAWLHRFMVQGLAVAMVRRRSRRAVPVRQPDRPGQVRERPRIRQGGAV